MRTSRWLFVIVVAVAIANGGCAGRNGSVSRIKISPPPEQTSAIGERTNQCKGFNLSESEVRAFFTYSTLAEEGQAKERYYRMLPCAVSGTAVINGERHEWIIRAGGIGEFYNEKERLIKICGKNCCDKVQGVC